MTTSPLAAAASQPIQEAALVEAAASPHVLHLIPSVHRRQGREEEQVQLATVMRSLVLDQRHPIALEVSGTDQQRCLLLRACSADDLKHAATQLQARLPQAAFVPLMGRDDPFHLRTDETVSVVELQAGQASYLPLQEFERMNNGADPILGILGAVDALPADLRAIAQLALVPAPPTWSRGYQRKALEHALEPERQQDRQKMADARTDRGAPSTVLLVLGALFLVGYFLLQYDPHLMPVWGPPTFQALFAGKWQQVFSGPHHLEVEGVLGGLALLLALPLVLRRWWLHFRQTPLYDMHAVAEKTARPAYQVRLRLYVIGPSCALKPVATRRWHTIFITPGRLGRVGWTTLCTCCALVLAGQWKQAAKIGVWPLAEMIRQSYWMRSLRIGALVCWLSLCRFVALVGARQWKQAAITPWILMGWIMRSVWSRGRRLLEMLSARFTRGRRTRRMMRQQDARRSQVLARLTAAYRQYHLASGNYFVPKRISPRRARRWVNNGTWWKDVHHSRHLLDVEALGALWHIPESSALPDLAHLAYRRSRSRLLPPSLEVAQQESPMGYSRHAGHRTPFGLPADCLQSHLLIGGKSGEGKSIFLLHLALRTMREHKGLVMVDPHGDLVEQTLALVPPDRLDDVVLLDLSDELFACGLNPIDANVARGRDKAISDLIKILSSIWGAAWGSRMEIAFEYALRTLYEANKVLCQQGKEAQQYTLLDVMPLLTEESFCHALLEQIDDLFIQRWWTTYYDPLPLNMQRDRVDPVLSKVAKFEGTIARHIVGQSLCTIDFTTCLEQKKIVLVKLARGLVGEDVARILGATVLGFLNIALQEQGNIEEARRHQIPILLDEFQTLDGVNWDALNELRKYGATFCLATQSLDYLREKKMLSVVLANVKQLAIFRMSADDTRMIAGELDVDPEDILHLESLTCYLKLIHQKQQQPTFSLALDFPPDGDKEQGQRLREQSQRRYSRSASAIETEIKERLAREIGAAPKDELKKDQKEEKLKEGQARQDGGNRGRKAQEKRAHDPTGEITPMNWKETVGPSSENPDREEEQEVEAGDRAE